MSFEDSLGFLIGRTNAKLKSNLNNAIKPYHVTVEQWAILNRLWEEDGISQKALSEKSLKDQPTITRILDKLEKRGLLKREIDIEDRRAFLINLTPEGWDLKRPLNEIARKTMISSFKNISPEEQELLKKLLNKIFNTTGEENKVE
ncbi:MAG: MarR family transcriptional regulator [Peptococcaceae bacterium]|nr:MarR family transcriptional regulator [Peptococcaceae bacterium]